MNRKNYEENLKATGNRNLSITENKNLMRPKQHGSIKFAKRDNITIDTNDPTLNYNASISDERILKLNGLSVTYAKGKAPSNLKIKTDGERNLKD